MSSAAGAVPHPAVRRVVLCALRNSADSVRNAFPIDSSDEKTCARWYCVLCRGSLFLSSDVVLPHRPAQALFPDVALSPPPLTPPPAAPVPLLLRSRCAGSAPPTPPPASSCPATACPLSAYPRGTPRVSPSAPQPSALGSGCTAGACESIPFPARSTSELPTHAPRRPRAWLSSLLLSGSSSGAGPGNIPAAGLYRL
jgi:hypothetical protein